MSEYFGRLGGALDGTRIEPVRVDIDNERVISLMRVTGEDADRPVAVA